MKRMTSIGLLAASAIGLGLRCWELAAAQLPAGRWDLTAPAVWILAVWSLLVLAGAIWMARQLTIGDGWLSQTGLGWMVGGLLLIVGSGVAHPAYGTALDLAITALGMAAGLTTLVMGLLAKTGKPVPLLLGCVTPVWLVVYIIGNFKTWSTDPALLDYCYTLFAFLTAMAGAFTAAGLNGGLGKRRRTAFWALAAVYFCAVAIPGASTGTLVLLAGLLVVNGQNVRGLYR